MHGPCFGDDDGVTEAPVNEALADVRLFNERADSNVPKNMGLREPVKGSNNRDFCCLAF